MIQTNLVKRDIDKKSLYKRWAIESDVEFEISDDFIAYIDWEPAIVMITLDEFSINVWEIDKIKWTVSKRVSWLDWVTKIFGYQARIPMRDDVCKVAVLNYELPALHNKLLEEGKRFAGVYKEFMPENYQKLQDHMRTTTLPEWVIEWTPWTSWNINKRNALNYHFDAGNVKWVRSAMVVMRDWVSWGNLVLPEYNIKVNFGSGNKLIIFDGQGLLHWVTPIKNTKPNGYRYSIVYYPLLGMAKCLPNDEEVKRKQEIDRRRTLNKIKLIKEKNDTEQS